jgi:type IV secretory pathway TraG/TraD family ATPase VirD4
MAITSNQSVLKKNEVILNAHPFSAALFKFWNSPKLPALSFITATMVILFVPGFSILAFTFAFFILFLNIKTQLKLPQKLPQSSGGSQDRNNIKAGEETAKDKAKGITCLGVDRETGYQYWEDSDTDRRHYSFLATTGSGKTYGLRFHMMMSLIQTAGFITIDGKGDIALPLDAISLIRRFGREDDVRILNFKQGNKNVYSETGIPRTNTFNPLSTGSTTYIAEVLKALISSDAEGAKGGDVFKQRAEAMCATLAGLATYRRDHFSFKIRPGSIGDMLELRELCRIYVDDDIPQRFKVDLELYFKTLPDFELSKIKAFANGEEFKGKQLEQHGYVSMQLQPALQILSTQYGFIFDTDNPEIDMKDVVTNNRILLVLLPAMEQSTATLQNTGKIILAALKGMIAGELGDKYQGNIRDLLDKRACEDPAPFKVFMDECGYYAAIPGIEILPAQGRGLGFSFYFIGQTYADYEKGGKGTADIIWDNTVNKTIGTAAGTTTYDKVNEFLGDEEVLVRDRMDINAGNFATTRSNTDSISIAKRKRLEIKDLASLREGQFFQVTKEKLTAIQVGDPQVPTVVKESRYNQLVGLHDIPDSIKNELNISLKTAAKRCKDNLSGKKNPKLNLTKLRTLESILTELQEIKAKGADKKINNRIALWQLALYNQASDEFEVKEDEYKSTSSKILANILNKNKAPDTFSENTLNPEKEKADENTTKTSNKKSWAQAAIDAAGKIDDSEEVTEEDKQPIDDTTEITKNEAEIEYLDHLLQVGSISREEYDEEISNLNTEEKETENDHYHDDDDDDQDPFGKYTLDSIPDAEGEYLVTPPEPQSSDQFEKQTESTYPSKKSREMEIVNTKEKANKILDVVDRAYDINI